MNRLRMLLTQLLLLCGVWALLPAQAQTNEDITPPTITAIRVLTPVVDATAGPGTLTVEVDATDDVSGVSFAAAVFQSPNAGQVRSFNLATLTSGDIRNGVFRGSVQIPQFADNGVWKLIALSVKDRATNEMSYSAAGSPNLFSAGQFQLVSNEDITPPTITAIRVLTPVVDATAGPGTLTVEVDATDDVSGVSFAAAVFQSPNAGQVRSFNLATLTSGDIRNGVFRGSVQIPQFADNGVWKLIALSVKDRAANEAGYTASRSPDLYASGTFEVFGSTPPDFNPDPYAYPSVSNAELSTLTTSDLATISGLNVGNTGAAASVSGDASCRLLTSRGDAGIGGSVRLFNGDTVAVSLLSARTPATDASCIVQVGEGSATFTVRTRAPDLIPDAFSFMSQSGVEPGRLLVSNSITVSGIEAQVAISVSNGQYAINGGAYVSSAGTVVNGDRVSLRHTASAGYLSSMTSRLSIGGVSADFTSTTRAADTTPEAFSFASQLNVELSSIRTSGEIVVSGVEVPTTIDIAGGSFSVNGGLFMSSRSGVGNGDRIRVRHTASSAFSATVTTRLTIGGVIGEFSTTTLAEDLVPEPFAFEDKVLRTPLLPRYSSNIITVTGINSNAPISVSGGPEAMYSVNGRAFTAAPGTVRNGDRVQLRNRIPLSDLTPRIFSVDATLTIGGVSDTWTISTLPR